MREALVLATAAAESHALRHAARGGERAGVDREPESALERVRRRTSHRDRRALRVHHAEVPEWRGDACRREARRRLARENLLLIVAPLSGDRDVAHVESGVHAAGDPREDDARDREAVEHRLGGHGGVHHAEAAQHEDHLLARECAEVVSASVHDPRARDRGGGAQRHELGVEGRHDGDARHVVGARCGAPRPD